jgi:hypothetical protein
MKKILLVIGIIVCCIPAFSQNRTVDSLNFLLKHVQNDTDKVKLLINLAIEYQYSSPDTCYFYSQQAFKISKRENFLLGISRSSNIIGNVYSDAGNYPKALEYYIMKLKIDEKSNNPDALAIANMTIANVHHREKKYDKALYYAFYADSIIDANNITRLKLYSLLNLGDMFEKSGKILSALDYTQKAYALSLKEKNIVFEGSALNNMGNIYSKLGKTTQAIQNYRAAIPLLIEIEDDVFLAETTLGLANQYLKIFKFDSTEFFGLWSHELSRKNGFLNKQLDASVFLTGLYKSKKDINKAFTFQEEVLRLKDSIFSNERIAKLQLISMEEDLRQKELTEKKLEEIQDRKIKLQYLTIGLLLPVLLFITLYLSNKRIKPKYIEFLGVVSLLLMFEFIMILMHPFIVKITHHMPLYQLMIFALIASVLTPLHHKIESWLLKMLTKKGKISLLRIRIQ